MKKRSQLTRHSSSVERQLRLEPLESRAMLAAGLLGATEFVHSRASEQLAGERLPVAGFAEVRLFGGVEASPALKGMSTEHELFVPRLSVEPSLIERRDGFEFRQIENEITFPASSNERFALDRPIYFEISFDPSASNRVTIHSIRPFDAGVTWANIPQRSIDNRELPDRREVRVNSPIALIDMALARGEVSTSDNDLLDRVISTIATDRAHSGSRAMIAATPIASGRVSPLTEFPSSSSDSDLSPFVSPLLSEGGMIELGTLQSAIKQSKARKATDHEPWKINRATVEQAAKTAVAEAKASPSDERMDVVVNDSGDGGLIAIASANLPRSVIPRADHQIEIRLDQNMGQFRSFQLAAAPGHDRDAPHHSTLVTVVRGEAPGDVELDDKTESQAAPLRMPAVAYAGVIVVSGVILTAELRSRKPDALIEYAVTRKSS